MGTICEIEASAGSRGADELAGIAAMGAFIGIVMVRLGYGLLGRRDSKFPFSAAEMSRWSRLRRLQHAGITPGAIPGADQA